MKKEKIVLEDGRYLIYYKFAENENKARATSGESKSKDKEDER